MTRGLYPVMPSLSMLGQAHMPHLMVVLAILSSSVVYTLLKWLWVRGCASTAPPSVTLPAPDMYHASLRLMAFMVRSDQADLNHHWMVASEAARRGRAFQSHRASAPGPSPHLPRIHAFVATVQSTPEHPGRPFGGL